MIAKRHSKKKDMTIKKPASKLLKVDIELPRYNKPKKKTGKLEKTKKKISKPEDIRPKKEEKQSEIKKIIPLEKPVEIEKQIETPIEPEEKIIEELPAPVVQVIEEKKVLKEEAKTLLSSDEDAKNEVEALLFAYGKYVEEDLISELCNIDKRKVKKILEELRRDYESHSSALMIFQQDKAWKINVREKYLQIVRKIVSDTELSKSVMETLAIIAWKSPIYQSEVVRIRGNKCYDHIDELETSGFVTKEKKGRSYILKTTDKFFNYFEIDHGNLKSVMDTVKMPEINIEEVSKQTTLNQQGLINPEEKDKVQAIDVLKKIETEEEKQSHQVFLSEMDKKLSEISEKNKQLEEEFPRPAFQEPGDIQPPLQQIQKEPDITHTTVAEMQAVQPLEQKETDVVIENPEKIAPAQINPAPEKPRSLTKKQLEKKFKDDLLRVREKMEKK